LLVKYRSCTMYSLLYQLTTLLLSSQKQLSAIKLISDARYGSCGTLSSTWSKCLRNPCSALSHTGLAKKWRDGTTKFCCDKGPRRPATLGTEHRNIKFCYYMYPRDPNTTVSSVNRHHPHPTKVCWSIFRKSNDGTTLHR
jgi:hypothetical protein